MDTTLQKNDEFQLSYDLKRDSVKKIKELQKIINKLADIPKSQNKVKRELRNTLCGSCRNKSFEILNLPVLSFVQVGCQTDGQLSDLESSQISKTETYDDKNGSAKQNISVLSLLEGEEEQDTVQIRTETTLSEQIKRLTAEKNQLQGSLKSQQEIIQKHEAALESKHEEHQTALTKLKAALSKKFERLTLENEELKNNMKTQQETAQKLRTMLAMKAEEAVGTYHQQQRKIQNDSSDTKMDASPDSDNIQDQQPKTDSYTDQKNSTVEKNLKEKEHGKQETSLRESMEKFEKLTVDLGNSDQSEDSGLASETESLLSEKGNDGLDEINAHLNQPTKEEGQKLIDAKDKTEGRLQTLQDKNRQYESEKEQLQQQAAELQKALEENTEKLSQTTDELEQIKQGACDDELQNFKTEKHELATQIEHEKQVKQTLDNNVIDLNAKLIERELELKTTKEKMSDLKQAHDDELESYKREKVQADSQIQQLERDQQSLQSDLNERNTKMAQTESKMKKIQAENDKLKENQKTLDEELEKLKSGKRNLDLQIQKLNQEKQSLHIEADDLNARVTRTESELLTTKARDDDLESYKREKVQAVSQIQRLEREQQSLQSDLNERNTKMAQTESKMKKIQAENDKLKENQKTLDDKLEKLKSGKRNLDLQIQRLNQEKQSLQTEAADLNARVTRTESELLTTRRENKKLTDSQKARDDDLESYKREKVQAVSQIQRLEREQQSLQSDLNERNTKMAQTESKMKKIQAENDKLKENQKTLDDKLEKLKSEKSKLDLQIQRLNQEKQSLQIEADDLDARVTRTESELLTTRRENKKLTDSQNDEMKKMSDQIAELSRPKNIVIGLRSEKSGLGKALVDMVTKELTRRLQDKVNMFKLNLNISFSQTPSEVTNGLQVVLCLNMSRVGTNITDTLKGMKADRDVFVMVLHHTNKENLTALTPTSMRVTGSEIRQLGGIMDMAFDSSNGLYECDLNNTAVDKIASILRKCIIV